MNIMNWEMRFLHWLKDRHSPLADRLMRTVTRMGDAGGFWIALSAGCVKSDKYRKSGLSMAIALLFSFIFSNTIIKNAVDRARPFWKDKSFNVKIREPRDYSFPSGHTSASIGSAVALFLNRKKEGGIGACSTDCIFTTASPCSLSYRCNCGDNSGYSIRIQR